jgi:CRISPR-associated endonuclease/helicase Cas3
LHGKQDPQAPEVDLAWRADVAILTSWGVSDEQIEQVLEHYPVRSQERLREPAYRVLDKLIDLAAQPEHEATRTRLVQVDADGSTRTINLARVAKGKDTAIAGKLLLLPEKLGNIERGMFRPEPASETVAFDVADRTAQGDVNRRRYRIEDGVWTRIAGNEAPVTRPASRSDLASFARNNGLKAPYVIRHPEEPGRMLVYFGEAPARRGKLREVPLEEHRSAVEKKAGELANRLLPTLARTYAKAGELHDEGKHHEVWQRAMGGCMANPIAKSAAPTNLKIIDGYRHELGSLLKAASENDDLLLHLIASHHAGARPFFEARQFDREALNLSAEAALESARRFARLQREWGPWGLAYLEAVFKCADGLVSAEEGEPASE